MDTERTIERKMYDLSICEHPSKISEMRTKGVSEDEMLNILSRDRAAVEEVLEELQ